MGKYCTNCGKELHTGARFCAKCGKPATDAPVQMPTQALSPPTTQPAQKAGRPVVSRQARQPAAPRQTGFVAPQSKPTAQSQGVHLPQPVYTSPAYAQMERPNKGSKTKNGSAALCIVLAIVLFFQTVAVAMYGWPGFAVDGLFGKSDPYMLQADQSSVETDRSEAGGPTGYSKIKISKSDYKTKPITVDVGPESTLAEIEGITVDFGEFNLSEEETLEIRDLGVKKDDENGFSAHCYDFSLGDVTEFPTYVTITLPYERTENAADRLFVQYYNDSTGTWELLYSELDESNGTITFYTDHFSTYALFDYFEYEKGYNSGPLSKVVFSSAKLDDMIDKCFGDQDLFIAMLRKNSAEDSGLINIGIDSFGLSNNLTSASDNTIHLVSSTGLMSNEMSKALGNSFGKIGAGLTAIKVGLSWYQSGNVSETLKKNKYDIIELGLSTAAGALGAAPLTVAAAGVWLAGMVDDGIRDVKNYGYENEIEHAYQEFTWEYVSYSNYSGEFGCSLPNNMPARAFIDEMKDAVIVNKGNTWAWLLQREFVKNRNNPQKMFESIDKLLDDYANVFWKLKPSARKMIAEDIHVADRWQEPGTQEITEYKEGLKAVLRYRLRKLFACLYERCILDAKQRLLWEINGFEKQMNTVTEFSVYASDVDGKEIPLSKTEYKDYIAAFAKSPSDKPTIWSWSPGSKDNGKFMCTLYNFITMGTPSFVKFYKTWEDQVEDKAAFTLSFTYSAPAVKLKIGNDDNRYYLYEVFDCDPRARGFADYNYEILRVEADVENNIFKQYNFHPSDGWKVWDEYAYNPSANIITSDNQDWHIELIPANDWKAIRGSSSSFATLPGTATKTDNKVYKYYRYLEVIPLSDGMWQVSETGETIAYDSFYSEGSMPAERLQTPSGQSFLDEVRAFAKEYGLIIYEGDRTEFD